MALFHRLWSRRPVRWVAVIAALLLLVGAGRWSKMAYESLYSGARGPYLQVLHPRGVTIRWQTETPADGVVRYGLSPERLEHSATDGAGRAHEVVLSGLEPDTRYFYSIDGAAAIPFTTPPLAGSAVPVRFWAIGDSGDANAAQRGMRDAAMAWMAAHPRSGRPLFDFGIALGDNAYNSGTNPEFQAGYFAPFAEQLASFMIWPVYGNHDARRWAHFEVFTLPQKGEAGGVASGTEHFYSFDLGQVHVVVLDSQGSDRSSEGPMLRWLRDDLKANRQPWLVAAFHHPPYTKGSHDSDSAKDSQGRMIDMRRHALPVLEAAGVDLVLTGHSHNYERSHLMDCHYGDSTTLVPAMVLERGLEGATFHKAAAGLAAHQGEVLVVAGSSSRLGGGRFDHPSAAVSMARHGSLVVDVAGTRMDARFIGDDGVVRDSFALVKGAGDAWKHPSVCK